MSKRMLLVLVLSGWQTILGATPVLGQTVPPDVVRFKSGGMVRGTILEKIPDSHVQLQTVDGRSVRYPIDSVTYAGPAEAGAKQSEVSSADVQDAVLVRGKRVRVKFKAHGTEDALTLHNQTSSAMVVVAGTGSQRGGAYTAKGYRRICTAPCDIDLMAGSHDFALSLGKGNPVEVEEPVSVSEPLVLTGEYDSDKGSRIAGWVILITSAVVGLGLTMASFFLGDETDCLTGNCPKEVSTPLLIAGLATPLIGLGISLPLILNGDDVKLTASPLR
ncbi:MAG: hypothetical protein H6714_03040 [Myxococcales bacterium]|nr:hypothetical protein [Myxococcales bacterium]